MQVREAMAKTISCLGPNEPLTKIAQAMKMEDTGFIPICEGDHLLGAITDRDIVVRCLAEGSGDIFNLPASHCMSTDIKTIGPAADLEMAARMMEEHEVRRLPVVEGGHLVGILSHGNLVQATGGKGPAERATVGVTRGA